MRKNKLVYQTIKNMGQRGSEIRKQFDELEQKIITLEKEIQKENVCNLPEDNFIDMFLDTMSVPDNIVGLIYEAESVSDLFDNRYVSLVPPKNVAELILIK